MLVILIPFFYVCSNNPSDPRAEEVPAPINLVLINPGFPLIQLLLSINQPLHQLERSLIALITLVVIKASMIAPFDNYV